MSLQRVKKFFIYALHAKWAGFSRALCFCLFLRFQNFQKSIFWNEIDQLPKFWSCELQINFCLPKTFFMWLSQKLRFLAGFSGKKNLPLTLHMKSHLKYEKWERGGEVNFLDFFHESFIFWPKTYHTTSLGQCRMFEPIFDKFGYSLATLAAFQFQKLEIMGSK